MGLPLVFLQIFLTARYWLLGLQLDRLPHGTLVDVEDVGQGWRSIDRVALA